MPAAPHHRQPPAPAAAHGQRPHRLGRWLAAFAPLLLAGLLAAGPAAAQGTADDNGQGPVTLNLNNADIRALISAVSDITGKSFVVDPRVQGEVTVISQGPTAPEALYDIFLSILKVHGFAAVESGEVVKILPEAVAKQDAVPLASAPLPPGESLVTVVVPLANVEASGVVAAVQPFVPPTGHLSAHPQGKVVILSDTAANAERLVEIIGRIDQSVDREVEVVRLRHADAEDLARVLTTLVAATPDPTGMGAVASIVADPRTNSLLFGGSAQRRLELRALIGHLDTPVEGLGNAEVIYLRYAMAEELAALLRETQAAEAGGGPGGQARPGGNRAPEVSIQADPATNALIIRAPPERLREFKAIIAQLDIRRAQVYVEGVIAEVSDTRASELGIQWQTAFGDSGVVGGTSLPGTQAGSINSFPGSPVSLGTGLSLGYLSGGTVRALVRALASDTFVNVLATPTLVTMDNEEAEIVVGQNVPFVTGQFTNNNTTPDNPFQTIQRQDVGIVLKVKPRINQGDSVTLNISQEVSSVVPGTTGSDLITNKRAVTTNVLADDGQIVVLGGLIQDDTRERVEKVPLLGDVPVLGNLFRNTRVDVDKTNLMVFLQPRIIRDPRTGSALTSNKYDYIRERQLTGNDNDVTILPKPEGAVLPPIEDRSMPVLPDTARSGGNPTAAPVLSR